MQVRVAFGVALSVVGLSVALAALPASVGLMARAFGRVGVMMARHGGRGAAVQRREQVVVDVAAERRGDERGKESAQHSYAEARTDRSGRCRRRRALKR